MASALSARERPSPIIGSSSIRRMRIVSNWGLALHVNEARQFNDQICPFLVALWSSPILGAKKSRPGSECPGDPAENATSTAAIRNDRPTSTPVVSYTQIPDFAAFPGVDIRAMVGVAKHATRAFLFHQRLRQQCDCSGVLATALSRSKHCRAHGDFDGLRLQRPRRRRL